MIPVDKAGVRFARRRITDNWIRDDVTSLIETGVFTVDSGLYSAFWSRRSIELNWSLNRPQDRLSFRTLEDEPHWARNVHFSDGIRELPNVSWNWMLLRWYFECSRMNPHWTRVVRLGNWLNVNYWMLLLGYLNCFRLAVVVSALLAYVMPINEREWTPIGRGLFISSFKWMFEFQALLNWRQHTREWNPLDAGIHHSQKAFLLTWIVLKMLEPFYWRQEKLNSVFKVL